MAADVLHPKLESIQDEIESNLLRRISEAEDELKAVKKARVEILERKKEKMRLLHSEQEKFIGQEQESTKLKKEIDEMKELRQGTEVENADAEKRLSESLSYLHENTKIQSELKDKYNTLLHKQIVYEARRVQMAGDLSYGKETKSKVESDLNELTVAKKAQDLYVESLADKLENLEQTLKDYECQTEMIHVHNQELEDIIRKAENDTEEIISEKRRIIRAWTTAVINVAKRDETIEKCNQALEEKRLSIKETKSATETAKSETVHLQDNHGYLTAIEKRHRKKGEHLQRSIHATKKQITESQLEFVEIEKMINKSQESYESVCRDAKDVERDIDIMQNEIQRLEISRRNISDEMMGLLNTKASLNKTSRYINSSIKELRSKTAILEETLADLRQSVYGVFQDIISKSCSVETAKEERDKMARTVADLEMKCREAESQARKLQGISDKNKSLIAIRLNEKAKLEESLKESTADSLETEKIRVLREELEEFESYIAGAKTSWVKLQNEYIDTLSKKDEYSSILNEDKKKLIILNQKRQKTEKEIEDLSNSIADIKKKISAKDFNIKRLNKLRFEQRSKIEELRTHSEGKRILEIEKIRVISDEIDVLTKALEKANSNAEDAKSALLMAEDNLSEWEERLKACKETSSLVNDEKVIEIEEIRSQIHQLEIRVEQTDKKTKEVLEEIKSSIDKRNSMVDKLMIANKKSESENKSSKKKVAKTLFNKKMDDLKNKVKKSKKIYESEKRQLESLKSKEEQLNEEINEKLEYIRKIDRSIEDLEMKVFKVSDAIESNLRLLIQIQNKIKWFKALDEKKYRFTSGKEDEPLDSYFLRVQMENNRLRDAMKSLSEKYPEFQENLKQIILLLN